MTDAVAVFPPGYRVLDENGDPESGAQIRFFDAGTTTPKAVYSDASLSTSLGSIVYTRSDGYPVSEEGGSTTVAVYTGTAAYKVDILDEDDVTIYPAKDNQKGAIDTSDFLTESDTSTLIVPVTAIITDTTLTAAHNGKLISASSAITLTMTAAATLGDNWNVRIRCNDASNPIKLLTTTGVFKGPGFSIAGFALNKLGAAVDIVCDGANFHIDGFVPGLVRDNGRIFHITDRVSVAPATTAGLFYIVTTAFSTFSIGDIIEGTGQATFIGYTPPTDCGWLAYVADEDAYYSWQNSGWVCLTATNAQATVGTDTAAFMTAAAVRAAMPTRAYTEYTTNADITTVIPDDNTIPQISEGTEILTTSISLKNAANRYRIRFCGMCAGGAGINVVAAIFRGGVSNALIATMIDHSRSGAADTTDHILPIFMEYEEAPGSAGPHTISVRVGPDAAGTIRMNGTTGAKKFGGVDRCTLVVEEVFP